MGTLDLLILIILAIAPLIGYILGKFTDEEILPGKKYFVFAHHVLFIVATAVFLYANRWVLWIMVVGLLAIFIHTFLKRVHLLYLVEAFFGLAVAVTLQSPYFFLLSTFIFLFGLPTGTLLVKQKKGLQKVLISGAIFLIIAAGLPALVL